MRLTASLLALCALGCAARSRHTENTSVSAPLALSPPPLEALPLEAEPVGRLPEGVTPERYALTLEIKPSDARFRGEVQIVVRTEHPRDSLWMHGQDLTVSLAEVRAQDGTVHAARWVPGAREGIAALRWEGAIAPGELTVRLVFDAPYNRRLEGLYRVDHQGDAYAFTQFEAISARRAFPCFDEPRFKTPFDITLVVAAEHRAITNTLEEQTTERPDGMRALRFARTLPLPTYLLAFAVGPLDVVDAPPIAANSVRSRPLPLRGVAPRGRGRFLARALQDTALIVPAMETYFLREFPYPKLDMIAVPDFGAGAMENAGAITFRENLLLVRPDAPVDQPRAVDSVIAHELAHHWFGNLVTLRWWDDIWLNESFATWMGTRTAEEVFPDQHHALGLLAGVHGAMNADALASAVSIRRPIETDHDLRGGSSAIVYQKGSAVLGMFERAMGPEVFREAIRGYLRAHQDAPAASTESTEGLRARTPGVATSADLYDALRAASPDASLEPALRAFVERPGLPTLHMDLACDASGRRVVVTQRRFSLPTPPTPAADTWTVPVCVRVPDGAALRQVCATLRAAQASLDLGPGPCPAWFFPNSDAVGYFRWTLPPARWRALEAPAAWSRLTPSERLSAVNNARAAFTAGTLDAAALRPLLTLAARDAERLVVTDPLPFWTRAVDDELTGEASRAARRVAVSLYAPLWSTLGWSAAPNEAPERALLRRDLAGFLGLFGEDPRVRAEGARRADRWLGTTALDPAALSPELVGPAVGMLLRTGAAGSVERVRDRALASDDAVVRFKLLAALAQAPADAVRAEVLPLTLDARLRVNETFTALNAALDRGDTRAMAFGWLTEHIDPLFAHISPGARAGAPWLGARFCRADDAERVRALFAPRVASLPGSEAQLRGALEAVSVCAAEREAQRAGLQATFGAGR